jgi:superfamily II DNA/RNA helicase
LVLDEADLLLSYGYEDDLRLLAPQVIWRDLARFWCG